MAKNTLLLASCAGLALLTTVPASAQTTADTTPAADNADATADEIVVTAVARGQNLLTSSVSVSSLGANEIAAASPRSVAELFRSLPGVRSESSGGEGNANIAVRGLPVASGGAKFLQLQEDGLPVLEFGDITFGNADIFVRADFNVARVETVRGGSASTFASNSPGGVINLISKTGEVAGGAVQGTIGLDYEEYRVDFDYGAPLGDDLSFHIGGFYRQGEGPRRIGYDGLKGGQIKANITKRFAGGYVRLFGKYLDDRAVGYLPNPVLVSGSNRDPNYQNLPNFSINNDSLHSRHFTSALSLNGANNPERYDITDGMRPLVKAVGFEGEAELATGLTLVNRFRYSDISGSFTSPFPASVDTATNVANSIGGAGSSLVFANGPNAGQTVAGGTNVARIVLFNTRLNSLDNLTNDLRLNYQGAIGGGTLNLTGGFYASRQDIDTEWLWTSHLLEVRGNGEAALLDVRNAAGARLTDNGTVAYGASFFGNCCRRRYDLRYTTLAPFASAGFELGPLNVDGSVRFDFGRARGQTFGADLGGGRVGVVTRDVDGNNTITPPETQTSVIPLGQPAPVNYNYDYVSYSVGANYRLSDVASIFGRYSRGGRANADRLLFNDSNVSTTTGALRNADIAVDFVNQAELGVKFRSGGAFAYATAFRATTQEQNFEATTQRIFDRIYRATGVELEAGYRTGALSFTAGGTYTDAKIRRDNISPANEGRRPRRQAKFIYQATGRYDADLFSVGGSVIGTTRSFAQDDNQLVLPAFTQVNAFLQVRPIERVQLSLNANNLFDVRGFTEAEEGSIPANGIVRARSINGRTISAALRFDF